MRILKTLAATAAVLLLSLFALSTPARAQHPHYGHALANLRQARALLEQDTRPGFRDERDRAIDEINRAAHDIAEALHEEGRSARFTPPPATGGDPDRPMRSALELLNVAVNDMTQGDADPGLRGLQDRTIHHINDARRALRHALHMIEERY
jgi:hypothetical protein